MKPLTEKCQWKGSVRDLTFVADYTFSLPFYNRQTEPVRIVCVWAALYIQSMVGRGF